MKIGKASYGGNKRTFAKLKDGDNVYRILPPMGDLADKGIWSVFYNVHYGYKNSEGKLKPFQSPLVKNYKTKMIEVPDAALDRINKMKAELEAAKASGNTQLVAKLNEYVGPKGSFNLDNNHYVNALDTQGNIVILKLRHRAKVALEATIKRLREKGVDPLSVDNGRFFIFNRSGTGLDTTFQVSVLTRNINVPGVGDVQQELVHAIDDALIARLGTEAADLDKLFKRPTADEVRRIVTEGAAAVDEILDAKGGGSSGSSSSEGAGDYDDSGDYDEGSSSSASASSASSSSSSAGASSSSVGSSAPVTTAATTVASTVAAVSAAAEKVNTSSNVGAGAPPTTAKAISDMSDADFLAQFKL